MNSRHLTVLYPVAGLAAILTFLATGAADAQPPIQDRSPGVGQLNTPQRRKIVDDIAALLEQHHLFPDKGRACAEHIRSRLADGSYDDVSDPAHFARVLTTDLRSINDDGHLRVEFGPSDPYREDETADPEARRRDQYERFRRDNFGFRRFEMLDGLTGYLDLTAFIPAEIAGDTATAAMGLLANCRAVIIDVRDNGGGSGSMVQLLASYFFSEPTHLVSYETRGEDLIRQSWTLEYVPGKRLPEVPLFILTSRRTASAAEEFTYDLKHHGRATVIGETTAGGGHTAHITRVAGLFNVVIPHGRPIHPVTRTDWDGVGVTPHIPVPAEQALLRARLEALKAVQRLDNNQDPHLEWAREGVEAQLQPVVLSDQILAKYAGNYGPLSVTFTDGALFGRMGGESPRRLTPLNSTRFMVDGLAHIRAEFVCDDRGEVQELITHFQDGQTMRTPRTP